MSSKEQLKILKTYGKVDIHYSEDMWYVSLYLSEPTIHKLYWMTDSILSEDFAINSMYEEMVECMTLSVGIKNVRPDY